MRHLAFSLVFVGSLGCSIDSELLPVDETDNDESGDGDVGEDEGPGDGDIRIEDGDSAPPPGELAGTVFEVTEEVDLTPVLSEEAHLVGVTRDADTAATYVLTSQGEIYSVSEDGSALLYDVAGAALNNELPQGGFTDFVALSRERFALTAVNEGFLLDTQANTLDRHFCYLPGEPLEEPGTDPLPNPELPSTSISEALQASGIDVWQLTNSLAYDSETGLLWAQPNTFGVSDDTNYGSELATFDLLTGDPVSWVPTVPVEDPVGGLAVAPGWVVAGYQGALTLRNRTHSGTLISAVVNDERISRISGLHALTDVRTGPPSLLLVDETQQALFTVTAADATDRSHTTLEK